MDDSPLDPEERLARLREAQHEVKAEKGDKTWIAILFLVAVAVFVYYLPRLAAPVDARELMLERSLNYCKFLPERGACDANVTARHAMCIERAEREGLVDDYARCMQEEFPDFHTRLAENASLSVAPK